MADFRNKQWFKALSDKEKEEKCRQLGCTLQGLKKAGFVEDGKLKIDLLRLEYPKPEDWDNHFKIVESDEFKTLFKEIQEKKSIDDILKVLEDMWLLWKPGLKFLKPDMKKCSLWIFDCKRWITNNIKALESDRKQGCDIDTIMCSAYKVYSHLRVLFESELNNTKQK